jgi:hypothetical protein
LTAPDALLLHWDCLFGAVCDRLRESAEAGAPETGRVAALEQLRATVIDCVSALEQLRPARVGLLLPESRPARPRPAFALAQTAPEESAILLAASVLADAIPTRGISP